MNPKNQTHCSSCHVYEWCFIVCCPLVHLCMDCVLDETIIDGTYVCPNCDRQLGRMYNNMIEEAQECLHQMSMSQQINFNNNNANSNMKMTRTNSFTAMNIHSQQSQNNFQNVQNSRQQQQKTTYQRNNFNQYNGMMANSINSQQSRNVLTRKPENNFNNFMNGPVHQKIQGGMSMKEIMMVKNQQNYQQINQNWNDIQQEENNFDCKMVNNNYNGQQQFNQMNKNGLMFSNKNGGNFINNTNFNHYQQQNSFNVHQQKIQQQSQSNSFTTNIRRTNQQQIQQQNTCQQFFFKDEIQEQQRFRSRGASVTAAGQSTKNFHHGLNHSGNNVFYQQQQNNNFSMHNNRTNKNIHINNFNQSNKNQNGQNHAFDQQNQFFFKDERMVKSATKLRKTDFSPNVKRNNFKTFENNSFSVQNILSEDQNINSEKDLSPTFGEGDIKEREEYEFEGRGNTATDQRIEHMNLKKSNSSFSLGVPN